MSNYRPYEFKRQDAIDFANHVGIKKLHRGDELFLEKCPYCNGSSTTGTDKKTFSINLTNGLFKCFRDSCGVQGNMITLSKDFNFSLGNEVDEYYRPKRTFKKLKTPEKPIVPKKAAVDFLESRGISQKVAEKYEITVQTDRENILVFPFYDEKGNLQCIKYRKTDFDKKKDTAKEWFEKDTKPILFGMKQCDLENKTLIVSEGQMDQLAISEAYDTKINVVSVPNGSKGMSWIPYCWNWLMNFEEIIVFGDYEKGHITLLNEFAQRFRFANIKHVKEENYGEYKDANDILIHYGKDYLRKCVEEAVSIPIKDAICLADVEDVDIFKLEKLQTGLNDIDRLLYGGIPFGGVTIISGKPGEGKSTMASQIMINAVCQGYKCFAYSGELPNYLFKAWTTFQVAGRNNVSEYSNMWGDKNYKVNDDAKQKISEWYRDKYYIYDNSRLDSDEKESLVNTCEKMIVRHGVRVILLDNLMTAIDLEDVGGSDKYEKQSQFVKKLSRLALMYNVIILLVAHKRKNNVTTNENDEVSGSGDITNLALITIAYEKNKEIDQSQRLAKVSKNRLFGKTNTDGWVLNYDEKSKRVYGSTDDVNKTFGWNNEFDGFEQINADLEEIPY
jgi:KaiC/GvpD/RAD55 family RecA-like ATPase